MSALPAGRQASKLMIQVYVLVSGLDGTLYIGMTNNLERRINEHNSGKNRSTKHKIPLKLLFSESYNTYKEARKREKYLKSGSGREYIKNMRV